MELSKNRVQLIVTLRNDGRWFVSAGFGIARTCTDEELAPYLHECAIGWAKRHAEMQAVLSAPADPSRFSGSGSRSPGVRVNLDDLEL